LYRKERKKRMRRKLSDRIDNILGEKIRSGSSDSCSVGERNENDPNDGISLKKLLLPLRKFNLFHFP
jgi:hypothetical protein